MKDKNKEIIERLREEFKCSYEDAKKIYDETRMSSKNLESEYKERLAQQEEEHELEIRELNNKHKEELKKNTNLISKLSSEKETMRLQLEKHMAGKENIDKIMEEKENEITGLRAGIKEQEVKIEKLRKELEDARETLRKKEKNIYDAKSKINDLQKAKHVLSFRTTEMRKSLEPKEAQIEKLREELFKLENEFESMFKTTHEQAEEIATKDGHIEKLNRQLNNQIIACKKKENELNRIRMDLFNCSKMKDNKALVQEFNKLYQAHVVEDKIKHDKHDPKGIVEMMRQIKYLENSIHQINNSTDKLVRNREMQIMKRTKDNIQLIKDLNLLKIANKGTSAG
jgi:chromosome segregation ATPase